VNDDAPPLSHILLDRLESRLAPSGFRRIGPPPRTSFVRRTKDGQALIHVQRSKWSAADLLIVTANLTSSLAVLDPCNAPAWTSRIGHVLPIQRDHWWEIPRSEFDATSQLFLDAVATTGVEEAVRHASTETMLDIWMRGTSDPFQPDFYRWLGLALLFGRLNRGDEARVALEEARNTASAADVPEWRNMIECAKRTIAVSASA
jgi:hypothetical protein